MSRYDLGAPGEEEFEHGSEGTVLRNRQGITDLGAINNLEAALLAVAQARSYGEIETGTTITVALIKQLHRSWLGALYLFAGHVRTIDLAKGFVTFAPAAYLENSLQELDKVLATNTPCVGLDFERVVHAIARRVHTEIVLVHPFREGNGRLSRWVADLMALQAGLPHLEWGFDTNTVERRDQYFAALRRSFAMDFTPLENLVAEALERAVRLAEDPYGES